MKSMLKVMILAVGLSAVASPALARGPGPFFGPWRGVAAVLGLGRAVAAPVVAPVRPAAVVAVPAPGPRWVRPAVVPVRYFRGPVLRPLR